MEHAIVAPHDGASNRYAIASGDQVAEGEYVVAARINPLPVSTHAPVPLEGEGGERHQSLVPLAREKRERPDFPLRCGRGACGVRELWDNMNAGTKSLSSDRVTLVEGRPRDGRERAESVART